MTIASSDLRVGDRFALPLNLSMRRGAKPTLITYTVQGFHEYRGVRFVGVKSTIQGIGSIALNRLPASIEVER